MSEQRQKPEPGRRRSGVPDISIANDEGIQPQSRGETILLVEDEPAVRQLFAQALIRAGYRVY